MFFFQKCFAWAWNQNENIHYYVMATTLFKNTAIFLAKTKLPIIMTELCKKIDFCFTYMAVDVTSLRSSSSYGDVIFVATQPHQQQQEHNSNSFFFLSEGPTTTPQKL